MATLSLFSSAKNFWAVSRMREVSATIVTSSLKIDWGREAFETNEIPLYLMSVDLLADDGSGRVFHWSGDPGKAAYPEEALDEFALWQKGTRPGWRCCAAMLVSCEWSTSKTTRSKMQGLVGFLQYFFRP